MLKPSLPILKRLGKQKQLDAASATGKDKKRNELPEKGVYLQVQRTTEQKQRKGGCVPKTLEDLRYGSPSPSTFC